MLTKIEYKVNVEEISALILKGIECWYNAGQKLCELIDKDPGVIDHICQEVPLLTPNILRQLERVGRRQLLPELLMKNGPGWNRLRLTSYETQKRFIKDSIEVAIITETGPDTLRVSMDNLTAAQARQAITDDGNIRPVPAQRSWLKANAPVFAPPEELRKAYSVHGRSLVITRPCKLSLQEIGVILAEMKA